MISPGDSFDQLWLIDGGEHLRFLSPCSIPLVHISSEGSDMQWSRGVTPHRYAEIMCNGADADVQWLPKAFPAISITPSFGCDERAYDVVQLASQRHSRVQFALAMWKHASDLHSVFGDIWGPLYREGYRHAIATWVCSNQDFVTSRVFEAMAAGCIVFADRMPSMLALFEDGVDFIGYEPVVGDDGEGAPDVPWFADQVRRLRREPEWRLSISRSAWQKVWTRHTMRQRCEQVLADVRTAGKGHAQ